MMCHHVAATATSNRQRATGSRQATCNLQLEADNGQLFVAAVWHVRVVVSFVAVVVAAAAHAIYGLTRIAAPLPTPANLACVAQSQSRNRRSLSMPDLFSGLSPMPDLLWCRCMPPPSLQSCSSSRGTHTHTHTHKQTRESCVAQFPVSQTVAPGPSWRFSLLQCTNVKSSKKIAEIEINNTSAWTTCRCPANSQAGKIKGTKKGEYWLVIWYYSRYLLLSMFYIWYFINLVYVCIIYVYILIICTIFKHILYIFRQQKSPTSHVRLLS